MKSWLYNIRFLITFLLIGFVINNSKAQISNCGITATNTSGCAPQVIILNASATSVSPINNSGYVWTIKNVTTGITLPPGIPSSSYSFVYTDTGYYDVTLVITNQAGQSCTVTKPKFLHIFSKPYANGFFRPYGGCVGTQICFNNTSTSGCGSLDTVLFDWKDGSVSRSNAATFCHTYLTPGTYCPTLYVRNSCTCTDDTTFSGNDCIVITPQPIANFANTDPTNCTSPYPITFTADPTGIVNPIYEWRLNSASGPIISTASNFTYNFSAAGSYNVYLKVTNPLSGCSADILKSNLIQIGPLPAPQFSSSTQKGCSPLSVSFNDNTSTSVAHSTSWIFSGGSIGTSNLTNPTVIYTTPGCYDVKMIVSFIGGCVDSIIKKNYVCVGNNIIPNFSTPDTLICQIPDTVTISYTGTPCVSCNYVWTSTEIPISPTNISVVKTKGVFVYKTYGNKGASLTVTDTFGCSSSITKPIYIVAQKLKASIKKVVSSYCVPVTVNYTNTTVSGSSFINQTWIFPGGAPGGFVGSTPPPIIYSTPGCYKITLIVENQKGCKDTLRDSICVGDIPNFNVNVTPNVICYEEQRVCFNFSNYSPRVDSVFVFPERPLDSVKIAKDTTNGKPITGVCYQYTNFGSFAPCFQVSDHGCRSPRVCATTAADSVKVLAPAANFQIIPSCPNRYLVRYKNTSKVYNRFKWTFWNGTTSTTAMDTFITYPSCGKYTTLLEAWNDTTGCHHSKIDSSFVIKCPVTDIVTPDTFGCAPLKSVFNLKSNGTTSYTVKWNFNAPTSGKVDFSNPDTIGFTDITHTFSNPGIYNIAAQIVDLSAGGCTDTIRKVAYVKVSGIKASFSASDTTGCIPFLLNVNSTSTATLATVQSCFWNFSDVVNNTSVNCNENHTFLKSGQYNVKLVVTSSAGCKDSIVRPIIANEVLANFSIADSNTCSSATDLVQCTNTSTGFNLKYQWIAPQANPSSGSGTDFQCNFNGQPNGSYNITLIVSDANGLCFDTMVKTVLVKNPIANYGQDKFFGQCPPLPVQFSDSSQNDICKWDWDFGDGNSASYDKSTFKNPGFIYSVPGTFKSKLTVTSCHGCVDSFSQQIIVIKGPTANVTFAPFPGGCPCTDVVFNIGTENGVALYFLPGCGQSIRIFNPIVPIGTTANPTYLYDTIRYCNVGTCLPQYIISDSLGCQVAFDKLTPPVVIDTPTVVIGMTKAVLCDSGIICFQDLTTYSADSAKTASRIWDFGDGTPTDNSKNPCHKYHSNGPFTVKLTVTNNVNCSNYSTRDIYIPRSPVANFGVFDTSGCITTKVNYTDSSTSDPRTYINSWQYWFGDATPSVNIPNPFHQFANAGTYTSVLIVKDTFGCIDSFSRVIKSQKGPTANAGADKTLCFGDSLQLSASGGVKYLWSPNYNISSQIIANPKVWPTNQTNYIVEVKDTSNCIAFDTVTLKISTIKANFGADTVCLKQITSFADSSLSTGATLSSYTWTFGDATSNGTGKNVTHTYASANTYNVKLVVRNTNLCRDSITKPVIVNPLPAANFFFDTVCFGDNTQFIDLSSTSSGNIVKWDWLFGDATGSSSPSPAHKYNAANTYTVRLTTTNSFGCVHDTSMSVIVRAEPKANFQMDSVCFGLPNNFTSTSTNGSGNIISNFWDFNYPSPSTDTSTNLGSASYQFNAGNHDVNLLVIDQFGCRDSITKQAIVFALPVADFTYPVSCNGNQTQFTDNSTAGSNAITNWDWTFSTPPILDINPNPSHFFNGIGNYPVHLEVTDSKGCKDSITRTISVYDNPLAKITIDDSTVCLGVAINLSDASTAGVSAPITSTGWDLNSDGSVDNTTSSFSYTYPTPNLYKITLIVKDQNGCSDSTHQSVLVHRLPIADFSVNAACLKLPSTFTSSTVLGDAPISKYDWVFPGPSSQTGSPASFTFTQGGDQEVSLSVTDNNGCTDSIIKTVFINTTVLNLTPRDTTICLGSSVGISAQGQFDNISWTPSTWVDNPNAASVIITPLSSIRYIVTATSGTCPGLTDTVRITVIRAPEISVTATPQEIILGLSSNITSEILGKKDSIVWSPDTALSCRICPNPIASPKQTTTYTATVYYGKDGIVCTNTASVTITVIQSCDGETVYIPNTFSPNADGNNDRFIIRGLGITKINHFRIFDRWGKIVFEANNVSPKQDDASWNGGLKNDLGKPENPGVFVYEFEVECITGEKIPGKGNITLIR